MNEMVVMEELKSLDHLVCNHERGFDSEFALAKIKGVLKTRTEQVHNHRVVIAFNSKPLDRGNACSSVEEFVNFGFVQ